MKKFDNAKCVFVFLEEGDERSVRKNDNIHNNRI